MENGSVNELENDRKGGKAEDESLMEYRPGRVLKPEELIAVKGTVTEKLGELMDEPCDEVFPEYVTVMVSNGKTIRFVVLCVPMCAVCAVSLCVCSYAVYVLCAVCVVCALCCVA